MKEGITKEQIINDYLYLLCCGVSGKPVDRARFESADTDAICRLARDNGLSSFIAVVLKDNGIKHPLFDRDRDQMLHHQLILETEASRAMDSLEKNGIVHAPLKGMFTRELYPAFATRVMGDVDILISKKDRKKAVTLLKEAGYATDHIDPEYHDTFSKGNCVIELHTALLHDGPSKDWLRFNKTVFDRLLPVSDHSCRKNLTVEDHYIYMIAHAYKHTFATGIGLRFLLDLFFFRQKYADLISSDYVRTSLKNMLIEDYEKDAVRLSALLFSDGMAFSDLNESDKRAVETYIASGINGTPGAASDVIAELSRNRDKGLIASYFHILRFLDSHDDWYALRNPFAHRHKWARPFYVMKLGAKTMLRRRRLKAE